jgi:hypothetical protein
LLNAKTGQSPITLKKNACVHAFFNIGIIVWSIGEFLFRSMDWRIIELSCTFGAIHNLT